ncbi:MAG: hypothetical protein ABI851_14155 [Saprospiraceae bacterium]
MKNIRLLTGLVTIILFSACLSPKYLPSSDKIDINRYGSYVKLVTYKTPIIKGELIAIDNNNIIVLTRHNKISISIPVKEVKRFSLLYAKPKQYWWSIPPVVALPFIHGYFSVASVPLHLITTMAVNLSSKSDFMYNSMDISYEKLKMFARYPQGIPPGIELKSIK